MTRTAVTTAEIAPPIGPFSSAVLVNGMLYSSGQIALDRATRSLIDGGVASQTRQIFVILRAILGAGGCSFADVVKANVYLADMDDFAEMNAEYQLHFKPPYPARTTIQAAKLPLGVLVEIEVVAEGPRSA